jgi:metallophosphoesterase superfamily enzyme
VKLVLGEVENRVQEVKGTLWRNNEKWINNELIFIIAHKHPTTNFPQCLFSFSQH